ncbi:MAG: hypothetical protein PHY08_09030 [Candidatus Cloacimonetes bacterium]|nr:hypothetical protein [Candidatus Cloacimonadota bacterium]
MSKIPNWKDAKLSDMYLFDICDRCGSEREVRPYKNRYYCVVCYGLEVDEDITPLGVEAFDNLRKWGAKSGFKE